MHYLEQILNGGKLRSLRRLNLRSSDVAMWTGETPIRYFWARYSFSTILLFIVLSFALLLFMGVRGLFKGLVSWKIRRCEPAGISGEYSLLSQSSSAPPTNWTCICFKLILTLNFSAILGNNLTKIQNNVR